MSVVLSTKLEKQKRKDFFSFTKIKQLLGLCTTF